jgi:MoaA/NifB/PqqE/SkfB family radical SAM enzyme
MTPEQQAEYDEACKPFWQGGGAITEAETKLHPWRVFLEINSACNLRCPTCTKGNQEPIEGLKYEHQSGFMDWDLMEKILDKIKSENPNAIVFTYGNSEPFLHPKLPEVILAIKARGLHPELSTNLNFIRRVPELLEARPDFIIISLSGWTQEVYVRGHAGGDIEKVKKNMEALAHANNERPYADRVKIMVNYHLYDYNEHEMPLMNEYANNLGLGFFTSIARAISMENAIQYCRSKDPDATPFEVQENRPDWNKVLPPIGETYKNIMDHLRIPPTKAREMYQDVPVSNVCPVGAGGMFTFIRHDGKTSMCACVADRRITVGDYLNTTPDEMIDQRRGHAICKQCIKMRLNLYFHIAHRAKWQT